MSTFKTIESDSESEVTLAKDELTPQNRKILCMRIGDEIGVDGALLDRTLGANTVEGLLEFRDAVVEWQQQEAVRQGYYSPRTYSDGLMPQEVDMRTPAQQFADLLMDAGFF